MSLEEDPLQRLELQHLEHEAWVEWATLAREIGLDLNSVDVVTFEPTRVALCRWALVYSLGFEAGVFTLPDE